MRPLTKAQRRALDLFVDGWVGEMALGGSWLSHPTSSEWKRISRRTLEALHRAGLVAGEWDCPTMRLRISTKGRGVHAELKEEQS